MNCSHGLAYEVKCSRCFSEAMARCAEDAKISAAKSSESQGKGSKSLLDVQEDLDSIQGLS